LEEAMLRDMLPRPLLKMDLRKESFALLPKRFFVFHLKPFVLSFFLSFFLSFLFVSHSKRALGVVVVAALD
jgi:hypothetical protein